MHHRSHRITLYSAKLIIISTLMLLLLLLSIWVPLLFLKAPSP